MPHFCKISSLKHPHHENNKCDFCEEPMVEKLPHENDVLVY